MSVALLSTGCQQESNTTPNKTHLPHSSPILLTDVTADAGIKFVHSHGGNGRHYFLEQNIGGCAFLDYDNDGRQDILLLQGAPLPGFQPPKPLRSALYRNNGDGTFVEATQNSGLDIEMYAMAVAVGDYDNDGKSDLYITAFGGNRLFRNKGNGKFEDVTARAGVAGKDLSMSAAWLDYNRDGHLDLFVCRYMDYTLSADKPCKNPEGKYIYCPPSTYQGTHSLLFRNNGNGTFADVTMASRIGAADVRTVGQVTSFPDGTTKALRSGKAPAIGRSMGVACADYNEDGWIDIYVTNDQSLNFLFVNNGDGTFREEADIAGVCRGMRGQSFFAGMGVDCGDYRNEGHLSLAVTNFSLQPITFYRNTGSGTFINDTAASGIGPTGELYVKWGMRFTDFDMDGFQDLFVATGHVFDNIGAKQAAGFDTGGELKFSRPTYEQPCQVFRNVGGVFSDVSAQSGSFFSRQQVARGAAFGDYDNDGDPDVLIACNNQPAILLRNDSEQRHHWLRLTLQGSGCNRDALGAIVRVKADSKTQTQVVRSGTSYMSDHDRRLLFGIGDEKSAEVEIRWPCGAVQKTKLTEGNSLILERNCKTARKATPSRT